MPATRHPVRIAAGLVVLLGVALAAAAVSGVFRPSRPSLTPAQIAEQKAIRTTKRLLAQQAKLVRVADALIAVTLPPQPSRLPAGSATPANLFTTPLAPVEVLGYVPYWEAPDLTAADFADTSVLAIYGVEVARNGSFLESGPGWAYYADTGYRALTAAAHRAGDRVLFTIAATDKGVISSLTQNPAPTGARLATAMADAVTSGGFDGVDIDIEGASHADRAGFVSFVADFVSSLRHDGMHKMVVLNCYPQSAGGSTDFFDVAKLAPLVNQIFVMDYDMEQDANSSANAPLTNGDLGLSDVLSLIQYRRVVPASKLVLGIP
ncbi:MAG: glycoside hydrolase family 18 protein, partial [Acidimicrobiales bacterium]